MTNKPFNHIFDVFKISLLHEDSTSNAFYTWNVSFHCFSFKETADIEWDMVIE